MSGLKVLIAAACGAGITWLIAYSAGFQSLWVIPIALILGPSTSFVILGPKEVVKEMRVVKQHSEVWCRRNEKPIKATAFVSLISAIFLVTTYFSVLGTEILLREAFSLSAGKGVIGGLSFIFGLMAFIFYATCICGLGAWFKERKHRYSLTRRMNLVVARLKRTLKRMPWERRRKVILPITFFWPITAILIVLSVPIVILILLIEFLRVVLTATVNAALRLAVNDRISAAEGAFFGGIVSFVQYWGSTQFFLPLFLAMVVGGAAGYGIFRSREAIVQRTGQPVLAY